jgi:GH24 family phage-related lysozyme (muramidase)
LVKGATGILQAGAQAIGADEAAQAAGRVTQDINRDLENLGTAGQVGGFVGEVAPYVALPAAAPTLAGRVALGAVGGGAQGALQAQETPDMAERAQGAVTGATIGAVAPVALAGIGKGLQAAAPRIDQEVAKLASRAKDFGIPLSMTQVAPSRVKNTLQKVTQELPFSGADQFAEKQIDSWNKAVAKTIGVDAERLTPDAVNEFLDKASTGFNSVLKGKTITATADDLTAIRNVVAEASDTVSGDALRVVEVNARKAIQELGAGTVNGQKLANFRSSLVKRVPRMEPGAKQYVSELIEKIDEVAERSIGPEAAKELQGLRRQWRNFKTLEPLLEKSANQPINPASLMQRVATSPFIKANRAETGVDDLVDLAKIGKLMPQIGGSDTFQKSALVAGGVGALVEPTTLTVTGSALGASRAYQSLYNQSQRLVNAAVNRSLPNAKPTMLQRVADALVGGSPDDVVRAAGSKQQAIKTVQAIARDADDVTKAEAAALTDEIRRLDVQNANPSVARSAMTAEEEYLAGSRPLTMEEAEYGSRILAKMDEQAKQAIQYAESFGFNTKDVTRKIVNSLTESNANLPRKGEALSTWLMRNTGGINDTAMRGEFTDTIPFVMRNSGRVDMSGAADLAFKAGYIDAPDERKLVEALKRGKVYAFNDQGALARQELKNQLSQTEAYYANMLGVDLSGNKKQQIEKITTAIQSLGKRVMQGDTDAARKLEQIGIELGEQARNSQRGALSGVNAPLATAAVGLGAANLASSLAVPNTGPAQDEWANQPRDVQMANEAARRMDEVTEYELRNMPTEQLQQMLAQVRAPMPTQAVSQTFLISEEGFRPTAYKDSVGITTIGYGFNLEQPNAADIIKRVKIPERYELLRTGRQALSEESARKLFDYKHRKSEQAAARIVPNFNELGENQRAALTSMAYHMGGEGLRKFRQTLSYLKQGNAKAVENQLLSSLMAQQTPARARRTALMLAYNLSPEEAEARLVEQGRIAPTERKYITPTAPVAEPRRQRVRYNDAKAMVGLSDV